MKSQSAICRTRRETFQEREISSELNGIIFQEASMLQFIVLGFLALIMPGVLALIRAALLRTREFTADLAAAELTRNPLSLASALEKLQRRQRGIFSVFWGHDPSPPLLRSHPPTHARINRLVQNYRHLYGSMLSEQRFLTQTEPTAFRYDYIFPSFFQTADM